MISYMVIFKWQGRRMGEITVGYNDGDARQQIQSTHPGATIISVTRVR